MRKLLDVAVCCVAIALAAPDLNAQNDLTGRPHWAQNPQHTGMVLVTGQRGDLCASVQ